jgi:hypothetical protein
MIWLTALATYFEILKLLLDDYRQSRSSGLTRRHRERDTTCRQHIESPLFPKSRIFATWLWDKIWPYWQVS